MESPSLHQDVAPHKHAEEDDPNTMIEQADAAAAEAKQSVVDAAAAAAAAKSAAIAACEAAGTCGETTTAAAGAGPPPTATAPPSAYAASTKAPATERIPTTEAPPVEVGEVSAAGPGAALSATTAAVGSGAETTESGAADTATEDLAGTAPAATTGAVGPGSASTSESGEAAATTTIPGSAATATTPSGSAVAPASTSQSATGTVPSATTGAAAASTTVQGNLAVSSTSAAESSAHGASSTLSPSSASSTSASGFFVLPTASTASSTSGEAAASTSATSVGSAASLETTGAATTGPASAAAVSTVAATTTTVTTTQTPPWMCDPQFQSAKSLWLSSQTSSLVSPFFCYASFPSDLGSWLSSHGQTDLLQKKSERHTARTLQTRVRKSRPMSSLQLDSLEETRMVQTQSPTVAVSDADFSGCSTPSYQYVCPPGWTCTGNTVCIASGNGPWGGPTAPADSSYLLGLQINGASISQTVAGLVPGASYNFAVSAANRPGYRQATLQITVDGQVYVNQGVSNPPFSAITFAFVAQSSSATVVLSNQGGAGDITVFVSNIVITPNAAQVCPSLSKTPMVSTLAPLTSCDDSPGNYEYEPVSGWCSSPSGTVCIPSGNRPWGGTVASSGSYFWGLQGTGAGISQTVGSLPPGQPYSLKLALTSRNGYAPASVLVLINNQTKLSTQLTPGPFSPYTISFTPADWTTTITIVNLSPPGDRTVFVNNLQIESEVPVADGNFSGCNTASYAYTCIPGWTCAGNVVCIASGNGAWGSPAAVGSSQYVLGIQINGASISQTVPGVVAGASYTLTVYAASRAGYAQATLQIAVDGQVYISQGLGTPPLAPISFTFVAQSTSATIVFSNQSPGGDRTVFLGNVDITVNPSQACAEPSPALTISTLSDLTSCSDSPRDYEYEPVSGWCSYPPSGGTAAQVISSSLPATVCIPSGSGPWGGTVANTGNYFVGLQCSGALISQTVTGLTAGQSYVLMIWMTSRNFYAAATVTVLVNGQLLLAQQLTPGPFNLYVLSFTPSGSKAKIEIANSSPPGDRTAFVNNLQILGQVPVANWDFSSCSTSTYQYEAIPSWTSSGSTVCIASGNPAWGGPVAAGNSSYLVGLQETGASISQTLNGLTPGNSYSVTAFLASRSAYGQASVTVSVDGQVYASQALNTPPLTAVTFTFVAKSGSATLVLENSSPPGDRTVFVSNVVVTYDPAQACQTSTSLDGLASITNCSDAPMDYAYEPVVGWSSYPPSGVPSGGQSPGTVCIASGSAAWGAPLAISGDYVTGLQNTGASVSQTLTDLTLGQSYVLKVAMASRRDYQPASVMIVVDGQVLLNQPLPPGLLATYTLNFTATAPQLTVIIVNSSPPGDRTVLLNDFSVAVPTTTTTTTTSTSTTPVAGGLLFDAVSLIQASASNLNLAAQLATGSPRAVDLIYAAYQLSQAGTDQVEQCSSSLSLVQGSSEVVASSHQAPSALVSSAMSLLGASSSDLQAAAQLSTTESYLRGVDLIFAAYELGQASDDEVSCAQWT